jgi:hypothetical protein
MKTGCRPGRCVISDANGRSVFRRIEPGAYMLGMSRVGYRLVSEAIVLGEAGADTARIKVEVDRIC